MHISIHNNHWSTVINPLVRIALVGFELNLLVDQAPNSCNKYTRPMTWLSRFLYERRKNAYPYLTVHKFRLLNSSHDCPDRYKVRIHCRMNVEDLDHDFSDNHKLKIRKKVPRLCCGTVEKGFNKNHIRILTKHKNEFLTFTNLPGPMINTFATEGCIRIRLPDASTVMLTRVGFAWINYYTKKSSLLG